MPSNRLLLRLQDIIYNIDAIRRYTTGLDESGFIVDDKTVDATLHCLLRITEAAAKLGERAVELAPDIPWKKIRGLGNILRHDYDMIERPIVWQIVQDDLHPLREACELGIARINQAFRRDTSD